MSCCDLKVGATGGIPRDVTSTKYKGVELDQFGRANEFKVFSCMRPWNRAFHASWVSFFVAFTGWFAMAPALEYLIDDKSNNITLEVKKTSDVVSVLGTIFVRFALGPVCERFGARRPQALLLLGGGILVALSATVNSGAGLLSIRFFIGLVGGAFVPCQYWTTMMFGSRVVGTANAFAGGWGNLGGGWALFFVATIIGAIRAGGVEDETAWRLAMLVPAGIMILVAIPILLAADDCPQGHWNDRLYNDPSSPQAGVAPKVSRSDSKRDSAASALIKPEDSSHLAVVKDYRVWILAIIYAACFGVELALNNSLSSYLYRYFNTDVEGCSDIDTQTSKDYPSECSELGKDTSSQIASLFGLMNLFARALGGIASDFAFSRVGMRGRLAVLFATLVGEAAMLLVFSQVESTGTAILFLVLFSTCVQASEGATFALVPFVNVGNIGNVAGIVGAGGNIGAVSWSSMFKAVQSQRDAYLYLSFIIFAVSALVTLVPVQGEYLLGCSKATADAYELGSEASEDVEGGVDNASSFHGAPGGDESVSSDGSKPGEAMPAVV